MNNIIKKILVILSLWATSNAVGQNVSLQNIIPSSPEASAFVKYGSYPVGTFTGRPSISISVYEIKTKKLTVPISLDYDATGIRVDDIAGWVGMNWSLQAGGMVSRTIVCVPDEENAGFLSAPPPRVSDIVESPFYVDYFKKLLVETPTTTNIHDTGPDRFSFSFNGKSGGFAFKTDKSIIQIPETSTKILIDPSGDMGKGFQIIDENGTKYLFRDVEITNVYTTSGINATSSLAHPKTAWHLSEMISDDGTDHIYFNYDTEISGSQKSNNFTETFGHKWDGSAITYAHDRYWSGMERTFQSRRLKSIVFTGGKVEFSRVSGRQDDLGSRLDEITVYSTSDNNSFSKLKSFKFQQGYYYSDDDYTNVAISSFAPILQDRYRLRLDTLVLKDSYGKEISRYQFGYNSTKLPPKTSCGQDWWGYANGKNNHTLVPPASVSNGDIIGGADRLPNEIYMKAGILEKIIYPTKGYTVFETEPHKYTSAIRKEVPVNYGGTAYGIEGQVHRNVMSFTTPGNTELVTFSGNVVVFMNPFTNGNNPAYSNANDQAYASVPPQVKIKNLSSGEETIYTSSDPSRIYSATFSYNFRYNTPYEVSLICYKNHNGAMVSADVSFKKFEKASRIAGGLRIKNILNYTGEGALANKEEYVYGPNENGLGEYTSIENFNSTIESASIANNAISGGVIPLQRSTYTSGFVFDQTPLQGSPVAYRYVTKYYGDATNNIGKTVYYYGDERFVWTAPLPDGMAIANNMGILILNDNWKLGNLVSQQDFKKGVDGTYIQVSKQTNRYNSKNTDATYGLLAKVKLWELVTYEYKYDIKHFAYAEYPVTTGYVQLEQTVKEENLPDETNKLTTTSNYIYDNVHHDFTIGSTSITSKGSILEVIKKYPFNKKELEATGSLTAAESAAVDNMIGRNLISPVLEEIKMKDGVLIGRSRTAYEFVNSGTIAPTNLKIQISTNPIETRLKFISYDQIGNLLEQQKVNDIKETYLWGYASKYPVAKIVGSDYTTVNGKVSQDILNKPTNDQVLRDELNKLRSIPDAFISTYTYQPLVGMTSETDPNGNTTYYEYDDFGRLIVIRDDKNNVLKKICYNYNGQQEDCNRTYYSKALSIDKQKNNCTVGIPNTVTYALAASKYNSTISQADADKKAQDDLDANSQNFANTNGSCCLPSFSYAAGFTSVVNQVSQNGDNISFTFVINNYTPSAGTITLGSLSGNCCFPNTMREIPVIAGNANTEFKLIIMPNGQVLLQYVTGATSLGSYTFNSGYNTKAVTYYSAAKSGSYVKSCPAGQVGSSASFSMPAYRYSSLISQADADGKAKTACDTQGQAYANSSGTCITPCGFNWLTGISSLSASFNTSGTATTFTLVYNCPSAAYNGGNLGTVTGGCVPSATRTVSVNESGPGGRIWMITISNTGAVSVSLRSGSPPTQGNMIILANGTYNK